MPKSLGDIDALTGAGHVAMSVPSEVERARAALVAHVAERSGSADSSECRVRAAMRYSLAEPGKMVRGHLLLLTMAAWGRDWTAGLELARAVEIVHAASLIVDDLPAMDDARLRRGRTATHHAYGDATTILASISMIGAAFEAIARADIDAPARCEAAVALARAIGPDGMAGGQERDVAETARTDVDVGLVHGMKTGALFAAAVEIGTVASGIDGSRRWLMSDFGMLLGKAFQELDDLIDAFGTAEGSGKDVGKDDGKTTFVRLLGPIEAERHALEQVALALECLGAAGAQEEQLEAFVFSLVARMRARYVLPDAVTCLGGGRC